MNGVRCAVLGGGGMLGSYLCETLHDQGASVVAFDIDRGWLPDHIEYVYCDLSSIDDAREIVAESPGYVFNLAAKVTGITYNENHHYTMAMDNSLVSLVPLDVFANLDCRYVYCSTACVYPPNAMIPTPEHAAQQNNPEWTNRGYGWSKLYSEKVHFWAHEENPRFRPLVIRPSNMYSQREKFDDPEAHVIPRLIYRLLSRENPMVVRGTGHARRTFLHARDAAEGLVKAAQTDYVGPLNLAASEDTEVSIRELVDLLCDITGMEPTVGWDKDAAEGYPRRLSCTKKFNEVVGDWRPPTSLRDGLQETVEACLAFLGSKPKMAIASPT